MVQANRARTENFPELDLRNTSSRPSMSIASVNIGNRLVHKRMVGNLAIAHDVFKTGQLVRETAARRFSDSIRWSGAASFAPPRKTRKRPGAGRVPTPPNRKHWRIEQSLDEQVAHGL